MNGMQAPGIFLTPTRRGMSIGAVVMVLLLMSGIPAISPPLNNAFTVVKGTRDVGMGLDGGLDKGLYEWGDFGIRAVSTDWPMFAHDPWHTSRGIDAANGIGVPSEKWSFSGSVDSLGAVIGNFIPNIVGDIPGERDYVVFSANGGAELVILDGTDGAVAWSIPIDMLDNDTSGDALLATPALADLNSNNKVDMVLATTDGKIYALEPVIHYNNGHYNYANALNETLVLWEYSSGGEITASSITLGNIGNSSTEDVIFATVNPTGVEFVALDGESGDLIWSFEAAGNRAATPVLYPYSATSNRVVAVSGEFATFTPQLHVYMIKDNGLKAWEQTYSLSNSPQTQTLLPSPAVAEMDGDDSDGKEIVILSPFEGGSGSGGGVVRVLKRDEGLELWSTQVGDIQGQFDASPAIEDCDGDGLSDVIVASWGLTGLNPITHVYGLKGINGNKLWERTIDTTTFDVATESCIATPALTDLNKDCIGDAIIVTTPRVYALDGGDGTVLWYFNLTATTVLSSSPAIGDIDRDGFIDVFVEGHVISHNIVDLSITSQDIEFTPSTVTEGESVTIAATVHNNGQGTGHNITVRFFDGNAIISEETIGSIGGYDTYEVTTQWTPATPGNHTIRVVVDPDNQVEEINEDDNEAARVIKIQARFIDLYVSSVHFYRSDGMECDGTNIHPIAQRTTTIKAVINNSGNKDAKGVGVRFYSGGNMIGDTLYINSIIAGGSGEATIQYIGTIGTNTIEVTVDEEGAINESNEGNNTLTVDMYFKSPDPLGASYTISGLIYLPGGQRLASNVSVIATNNRTSNTLTLQCDEQGRYSFDVKDIPGGYMEEDRINIFFEKGDLYAKASVLVYSEDEGAMVSVVLREKENFTFTLTPQDTDLKLEVGTEGAVALAIKNEGNTNATYELRIIDRPTNWDVYFNPSSTTTPTVPPGESYNFEVRITPAHGLNAGDVYTVRIGATCLQETNLSSIASVSVEILPTFAFSLALVTQGPWDIDPYFTSHNYTQVTFSVANTGNIKDTYNISLSSSMLEYLTVEYIPVNTTKTVDNGKVTLERGENISIEARVFASPAIMEGGDNSFSLAVVVSSVGGNRTEDEGITVGILYPDLKVEVSEGLMSTSSPIIGLPLSFNVRVVNVGQGHAPSFYTALLKVESIGGQEQTTILDSVTIPTLAPGEGKEVTLTWSAVEAGSHTLRISADVFTTVHELNRANNAYTKPLTLLPDLTVTGADIEADEILGGYTTVTITVEASNLGNTDVGDVKVAVYYTSGTGGTRHKLGEISIRSIPAGGTAAGWDEFEITNAKSGSYEFIFVIDPNNLTWEMNEDNNEFTKSKTLTAATPTSGGGAGGGIDMDTAMWSIAVIVIAMIFLVYLLLVLRRLKMRRERERRKGAAKTTDKSEENGEDYGDETDEEWEEGDYDGESQGGVSDDVILAEIVEEDMDGIGKVDEGEEVGEGEEMVDESLVIDDTETDIMEDTLEDNLGPEDLLDFNEDSEDAHLGEDMGKEGRGEEATYVGLDDDLDGGGGGGSDLDLVGLEEFSIQRTPQKVKKRRVKRRKVKRMETRD